MANTWGFGTDTGGFSDTIHDDILKAVVSNLRAGLIALPRGAVVPASVVLQSGNNFTLRYTSYPDIDPSAVTNPLTEGIAPSPINLGIIRWTSLWLREARSLRSRISPATSRLTTWSRLQPRRSSVWQSSGSTTSPWPHSQRSQAPVTRPPIPSRPITCWTRRRCFRVSTYSRSQEYEYYYLCHPNALRGLESEADLNTYVDVTAQAKAGDLTRGAVSQYRGITYLTSTKFVDAADVYPVYFLGKDSMAAGDVGTLSFHFAKSPDTGNELSQLSTAGFKAIFGAKPYTLANRAHGAGTNEAGITRVIRIGVATGVIGFGA